MVVVAYVAIPAKSQFIQVESLADQVATIKLDGGSVYLDVPPDNFTKTFNHSEDLIMNFTTDTWARGLYVSIPEQMNEGKYFQLRFVDHKGQNITHFDEAFKPDPTKDGNVVNYVRGVHNLSIHC